MDKAKFLTWKKQRLAWKKQNKITWKKQKKSFGLLNLKILQ